MGSLFEEFVQLEISKEMDRQHSSSGTKSVGQSSGSGELAMSSFRGIRRRRTTSWFSVVDEIV